MHLLISKKIVIYLLLFCFLVSINNTSLMNISFPKINEIEINGLNLDERSRDIMKSRWLSENKLTLEDLSKKYDISRERIRQIENETMSKLKENL